MRQPAVNEPGDGPRQFAYEQVADGLRDKIYAGELTVGERLPSETELARRLGVSRPTVREALRALEESGFVERISPRIMAVRDGEDQTVRQIATALQRKRATFADLHEALRLLEPALSREAAARARPEDLRRLEENLDAQDRAVGDPHEWNRLDQEFHLAIAEIAGNPLLVVARGPITRLLMPALDRLMSSTALQTAAIGRHRRILGEIAAGDGEAAELMTRRHIDEFLQAWSEAGLAADRILGEVDGESETGDAWTSS